MHWHNADLYYFYVKCLSLEQVNRQKIAFGYLPMNCIATIGCCPSQFEHNCCLSSQVKGRFLGTSWLAKASLLSDVLQKLPIDCPSQFEQVQVLSLSQVASSVGRVLYLASAAAWALNPPVCRHRPVRDLKTEVDVRGENLKRWKLLKSGLICISHRWVSGENAWSNTAATKNHSCWIEVKVIESISELCGQFFLRTLKMMEMN